VAVVTLSAQSRRIAGILLLTIVAVEFGGYYLTRVASGAVPLTEFQQSFARAGHAHAGVLVILSLVAVLLADAGGLHGRLGSVARHAIPAAAILMSAGFFVSSMGEGLTKPNGFIVVLWLGAASLAVGVISLGVGLLRGGAAQPVTGEPARPSRAA
jgi:hypothetical protein